MALPHCRLRLAGLPTAGATPWGGQNENMKKIFWIGGILLWALWLPAQTNSPVRLAIVPETPAAGMAVDLLTVEFSSYDQVHLLERAEIEKACQELKLSAANRADLKLGQMLGADGLLLVDSVKNNTSLGSNIPFVQDAPRTVNIRLIAVKPGVVLAAEKFLLRSKDLAEWSPAFVRHLNPYLPKLHVLAQDAMPISLVNLRSAVASAGVAEMERQLKTLAVQRLSREPQLFILERERMQSLSAEKELQADDSAFWKGSYLLEGVVDQNGYAKDVLTLSARLTPPKGGQPLTFETSGSRTNLAEVVNRLAGKVAELLKVSATGTEWNAKDEAEQFFNEAKWALRWGAYSEAQAAAESSWALGRQDLACAVLRNKTYLQELSAGMARWQNGQSGISASFDINGKPVGPEPSEAQVNGVIKQIRAEHQYVHIIKITRSPGSRNVIYAFLKNKPAVEEVDRAIRVLELYQAFSHTPADGQPKVLWSGTGYNDWRNSEWYQLGVEDLAAASKVLQCFNLAPDLQPPVADKLAELRRLARTVANTIVSSPSVRDSYFVGDRIANHDELSHTIEESENIFRCELKWGVYWQEKPEDELALYRELLASPVFCYLHHDFWSPEPPASHLIAWQAADQPRLAALWNGFVAELSASTNVLLRMESQALLRADAASDEQMRAAEAEWWSLVRSHRDELVENKVELFYLGWGFISNPETEALDQEYWMNFHRAKMDSGVFEKQKRNLAGITPDNQNAVSAPAKPLARPAANTVPAPAAAMGEEMVTNVLLVNKFLPVPLDGFPGTNIAGVKITAHHWLAGKLLLDFQCGAYVPDFDKQGNRKGVRSVDFSAIAILDPISERWQVIRCPEVDRMDSSHFYHRTTLFRGTLFTSNGGQIRKYDAAQKAWQTLDLPVSGNCELFVVNDRLFAATHDLIVEILDGGARVDILASNRRQPPVSALDTESLGTPILFPGPGQSLRAAVSNKMAAWDGQDWRTICSTPPAPLPPLVSGDSLLYFADDWNVLAGVWRLAQAGDHVEYCFGRAGSVRAAAAKPQWKLPPGISLSLAPAISRGADMILFVDHAKSENIVDEKLHLVAGKNIFAQNGYHAELLCFASNFPAPQTIRLKFAGAGAGLPVSGEKHPVGFMIPGTSSAWLEFSSNSIFCAQETPGALPRGGGDPRVIEPKTGVWLLPLAAVDAEIARQKLAQRERQTQSELSSQQCAQALLVKYDRNHDGVIDLDERENALDDPAFIQSELAAIDANHNGWLDADELAWFDANQNKILEAKEQAGIALAQRLLAEKLMDDFGRAGDGGLLMREYNTLIQSTLGVKASDVFELQFAHADENHDGHVDAAELEHLLQRHTTGEIRRRQMSSPMFSRQRPHPQPADAGQGFKSDVESYWQPAAGAGHQPSSFRMPPP